MDAAERAIELSGTETPIIVVQAPEEPVCLVHRLVIPNIALTCLVSAL